VAAGPVGRTANADTDVAMTAEILAWSRSKGLFAGISLSGATLRNDADVNAELYGKKIDNKEVLSGSIAPPPAAQDLRTALDKYSMRK
jgi:lipid-binding SYLF domain-containing protein